jgi:hypothetical protein
LRRISGWPVLAAAGTLLAYGAPVLLSGSATFTGYLRLDDTATWLDVIDHAMTHLHTFSPLLAPTSTYEHTFSAYGPPYPFGSFMLPAVGHAFTGIDSAWIIQPYMACCGAAIALCAYALVEPVLASPRIRALIGFVAAQPALLYGYSLWGGVKELTAAFLLILGVALVAQLLLGRRAGAPALLPVAIAAAALILTLGVGAAAWVVPALVVVVVVRVFRHPPRRLGLFAREVGALGAMTAVFALPVWLSLSQFLNERLPGQFSSSDIPQQEKLGHLLQPLSGWQLAGIWPVGDFRLPTTGAATPLLIGVAAIAAGAAIWLTVQRRQFGVATYLAVALVGCGIFYAIDTIPWLMGKALALSSPAPLLAALTGAGMMWRLRSRHRALGAVGLLALVAIGGGVAWSNVLAYHDAVLAPRQRLAELQHIGGLLAAKGPTFINQYEIYADRHFLRSGAPVEPAEYRSVSLRLRDGTSLTKSAYADLDSFALATLEPYRSIVTTRAPIESRPPSIYKLVWQGRYYQLWQRPLKPSTTILAHVPLGDSSELPYCGVAENGPAISACSIAPATIPPCSQLERLAGEARGKGAELVAYQRPLPIVIRGDQTLWPEAWIHNPQAHALTPTMPGTLIAHIAVNSSQRYELWLGGSFSRGFEVRVDGRSVGRVKDELGNVGDYVPVTDVVLTAGVHTFALTYPHSDLTPGSGENEFTTLTAIALNPLDRPPSALLMVAPNRVRALCGRPLDWIEVVAPAS